MNEYLTEKVEWKRNLNSLLKKFNYNPDKGTIKYKGNEYNITIDRNGSTRAQTTPVNNIKTGIRKGSLADITTIYINPDDFRYNSINDMETAILHEIGHAIGWFGHSENKDSKEANDLDSRRG